MWRPGHGRSRPLGTGDAEPAASRQFGDDSQVCKGHRWNLREHHPDQRLDEHREALPLIGGDAPEPVCSAGFDPGLGSILSSFALAGEALQVLVGQVLNPVNPGTSGEELGAAKKVSCLIEMAVVQERLGGIERDLRAGGRGGDKLVVDARCQVGPARPREDLGAPGVEGAPARIGAQPSGLFQPVECFLGLFALH